MRFVLLFQTAKDGDRILDIRLVHQHRLKTAFQRGVLFDVLAVFVQRRRADHMQLAARQHRLEQIAGVHGALGFTGADNRVQFVHEEQYLPLGGLHVFEHGLKPLFKLAAVLRARDQGAHIERDDAFVFEPLGHVAADDALGKTLDDGSFADAGIADQHRVVFRPA